MNNKELVESGMNIMYSFQNALQEAGGVFSIDKLKKMTAYELITTLATNNISFVYNKEVLK